MNKKQSFQWVGIMFLILALVPAWNAQSEQDDLDIFIGGKKYRSIKEYREFQRNTNDADSFPSLLDSQKESRDFIESFLDVTLERLSEEDLKKFLYQLKARRGDLFQDEINDPDVIQMKRMLNDYMQSTGRDLDIELDPFKIKTIRIDPNAVNKKQSISVQPKKQMIFSEGEIDGLGRHHFERTFKEFQNRKKGPLSKKSRPIQIISFEDLPELVKQNPKLLFTLFYGNINDEEGMADGPGSQHQNTPQYISFPISRFQVMDDKKETSHETVREQK